ncbi:hypothetical protein Tco_1498279, partial [Tanacetum coccineum]
APSAEETEPFETDESAATPPPHPPYRVTARMSIRDEPPTPFWYKAEVARLLAIPSPPPSPLSLWSSPLPHIPSPPLPLVPPPLPRDVGYRIIDTWDEMLVDMPGAPATDEIELGQRMINFVTTARQNTDEIYVRLDDEQTKRQLMAGRLNMLYKDRLAHARIALLMEREDRMSQEAWGLSMMLKMAPKNRTTRLNPKTTTTTPATTSVTNAQLKAMIDQGVTAALAARDANTNGIDSHNLGIVVRRNKRATRECTYPDFMKCQPLNFEGTEG